ncbi:hypothetical protein [Anaerotignum propionicum]|nr:hypothetical protein [Anaerotignum propionicum]
MKKIAILVLSAFVIFSTAACNAPSKAEGVQRGKILGGYYA